MIQFAVTPTVSSGVCGIDAIKYGVTGPNITDFVNYAHRAGVKALIGVSQDPTLTAMKACTAPQNIAQFVALLAGFVIANGYDGVDIAWGDDIIQSQYFDLITRLRTSLPQAILTAPFRIRDSYLMASVQDYLDQANVMSYGLDIYNVTAAQNDHNGFRMLLTSRDAEPDIRWNTSEDNISELINVAKIGLGVPFYGRVEQGCLDSGGAVGLTGPHQLSLTDISVQYVPYRDLVSLPYWSSGIRTWDPLKQFQYLSYIGGSCQTDAFIPYAAPELVQAAIQEIKANGFGGIMTFGLPYEYSSDQTDATRYPLSDVIRQASVNHLMDQPSQLLTPAFDNAQDVSVQASQSTKASVFKTQTGVTTGPTFTYYVDSASGSDSNPGTLSAPWKTVAKVNQVKLMSGQSIGFKAGGLWREQLTYPSSGSAGEPIVYGTYGSGSSPIISGSDLVSSGWLQVSSYVWKAPVVTRPNVVYFNGIRGTLVSSQAGLGADYQWFWSSNILYIWSPASANPSTYYTVPGIEAGARNRVVQTNDQSYVTLSGITIRDANGIGDNQVNVGSTSVNGIVFENCTIERGVATGIELKGSTSAGTVTIDHSTIRDNGGWGMYFDYQYLTAWVSNNTITGNGWRSVSDNQEYDGIEGQLGNTNIVGNSVYANAPVCNGSGMCHGIYVDPSTTPVNIYNNLIYSQPNGNGIKTRGSASIYGNTIYFNNNEGIEVGGNGVSNITVLIDRDLIYNNNISNCCNGITEQSKGSGTLSLTIDANTLYQNGNTSQQELKISDTLTAITILDNIFFATPGRRTISTVPQTSTSKIDYNLHWRSDGNPIVTYNGTGKTWSAWQALGFDTHAPDPANPMFNNPATNFVLKAGSPAIGAGLYIPGVSIANPANIGVF